MRSTTSMTKNALSLQAHLPIHGLSTTGQWLRHRRATILCYWRQDIMNSQTRHRPAIEACVHRLQQDEGIAKTSHRRRKRRSLDPRLRPHIE